MPQDYSGQNLRGRSFRGLNLEFANFSGADIRSADFSGAILIDANFSDAKAGLQKRWAIFLVLVSWVLMGLSGFLSAYAGILVAALLFQPEKGSEIAYNIAGFAVIFILILFCFVTIRQGIQAGLGAVVVAGAVAVAVAGVIAVAGSGSVAVAVAGVIAVAGSGAVAGVGSFAVAGTFVLLSTYISRRALKGDPKHALIRDIAVAFAASRGTSFRNANLSNANFTAATLESTDFRKANLTRTSFHKTKKLDRVRPGKTYLQKAQVRDLLVTRLGLDQNFDRQDLRGVNFIGANLVDASFVGADLSKANLQDADLSRAKLVQAQLDGTDFTGATLTGAYIRDWNITSDTKFDGVRCEYVYMRLPTKENPDPLRKPDNNLEVFKDGEFGDFIQPIFDTLDLYHNQSVDPRAIAVAFKELAENNPNAELEIVAIERRGDDKILLRTKTEARANKSELSKEYFLNYNQFKELAEKDIQALIAAKESQIMRLENMVLTALERPSFYTELGDIKVGNIKMAGGAINTGDINVIENIETLQTVATLDSNNDVSDALEIKIIKGSGMLVGEQSELVLEVTNTYDKPIEHLEIEIIQDSAEYQVNSENRAFLTSLNARESREASFYLQMNFAKQIAVNYKINGKLKKPPLYINAVQDNPYIYGSPVEGEKAFFGRQKELEQIIQAVTKPTKQDILIVGERRTGKTSLLNQLQNRLDIPLIPIYVVLNTSEESTTESLLKLILQETLYNLIKRNILRDKKIEEIYFKNSDFIKQYKQIISEAKVNIDNLKIILLLDEADYLLKVKQKQSNVIDERIQNILRAALQSSDIGTDLRAVVAATTDLSTYISQHSSPFYNHFRFVPLKPLSVKETEELIVKPASMLSYSYEPIAIEKITRLSGGQPYYAQAICYEAFENAAHNQRTYISNEDIYIAEQKIVKDFFDSFLSGFWNRCNEVEINFLIALAEKDTITGISREKIKRLLDWQIIIKDINDHYFLSSELIKQWITMIAGR